MGKVLQVFLDEVDDKIDSEHRVFVNHSDIYACRQCKAHLSTVDDIVSKSFQGRFGRAYLTSRVFNVSEGSVEQRNLTTGLHVVCDISCSVCGYSLGWKYLKAYNESQKYKEQKAILESMRIVRLARGADGKIQVRRRSMLEEENEDDEDEDEEEDEEPDDESESQSSRTDPTADSNPNEALNDDFSILSSGIGGSSEDITMRALASSYRYRRTAARLWWNRTSSNLENEGLL